MTKMVKTTTTTTTPGTL